MGDVELSTGTGRFANLSLCGFSNRDGLDSARVWYAQTAPTRRDRMGSKVTFTDAMLDLCKLMVTGIAAFFCFIVLVAFLFMVVLATPFKRAWEYYNHPTPAGEEGRDG